MRLEAAEKQGWGMESSGVGLSILVQLKHGFCRGDNLGYVVRKTYTRTSCRKDRQTQQSRFLFLGGRGGNQRKIREFEAGVG